MTFSKILFTTFALCCCVSIAHSQYLRKRLKPAFFIPESELNYKEKLPPIVPAGTLSQTIKKLSASDDEPSNEKEKPKQKIEKTAISTSEPILDEKLHPDYKEKYDEYLADLSVLAETGKLPQNKTLEEDLKKMNSNSAFVVK